VVKRKNKKFGHHHLILFGIIIVVLLFFGGALRNNYLTAYKAQQAQDVIEPFYMPPNPLPDGKPGDIIRSEPLSIQVPNGKAYRVLYLSELADRTRVATSGIVYVPNVTAPPEGRTVVAWAHGTIGMGEACAPSRSENPLSAIQTWIGPMMQRGWVVAATDYYGLGTPGTEHYLIGSDEARDVINSVRAARQIKEAQAGNQFGLFGHSQGGHAVLFSASEAKSYAPELSLIAAAAVAPAAELTALIDEQYDSAAMWAIGPEINVAWPLVYDIPTDGINTNAALNNYKRLAEKCINKIAIEVLIRNKIGQQYFISNPVKNREWYTALEKEIPPYPPSSLPVMIAQGLSDNVVLPNTTALYIKGACNSGSNLTTTWMGDVQHIDAALIAGPFVTSWLDERFAGIPVTNTCNQPLPITPATRPLAP